MTQATSVTKSPESSDGMFDAMLIPENTVVAAKGDGPVIDIGSAANRVFLVTVTITRIVEQESFELLVYGSPDGQTFAPKPLATTPQLFYPGKTPILVDFSGQPEVKFLRAHWEVNRWGRGSEQPMFEVSARVREVPPAFLSFRATEK